MMKYFARRGILVRPWLSLVTEMIAWYGWLVYDMVMAVLQRSQSCAGRSDGKEKREDNTRHSSSTVPVKSEECKK